MRRALVLIGVGHTGGDLDTLESIGSSFRDMRKWAEEQGFGDHVYEVSDLDGKSVYLKDISELIETLENDKAPPEQLIIYFNGHGFRNGNGDLWLLSKAPKQPSEAVNLFSSVNAAYYRYFNHVVLISDACRVAPQNLQFAFVLGGSIFPNETPDGLAKSVDLFYASAVGDPALEVSVDAAPCSIYTLQLSEFLRGSDSSLLEMFHAPDKLPQVIRSYPLKKALATSVRQRLLKNGYKRDIQPDAILNSDPNLWLSTFDTPPQFTSAPGLDLNNTVDATKLPAERWFSDDASSRTGSSSSWKATELPSAASQTQLRSSLELSGSRDLFRTGSESWIPEGFHYETSCGFLLLGAESIGAKLSGPGSVYSDRGSWVRFEVTEPRLALVKLQGGNGFLLPVLPGQIGFLRFDGEVIKDIAYEPSANYGRGYERQEERYFQFRPNANIIRGVRQTLSSAAASGSLLLASLSEDQILEILDVAAYTQEDVDLMLLVLLGYACAGSGKHQNLGVLCDLCLSRLGFLAYDLHLLAELGPLRGLHSNAVLLPPFPLVAQGWALLSDVKTESAQNVMSLREHIHSSAWTLLTAKGVSLAERYVRDEETQASVAAALDY